MLVLILKYDALSKLEYFSLDRRMEMMYIVVEALSIEYAFISNRIVLINY